MKRIQYYLLMSIMLFTLQHCNKDNNVANPTISKKDMLTSGIWEVDSTSQVGEENVQLRFITDGTGQTIVDDGGGSIERV